MQQFTKSILKEINFEKVSIPQAVGTVATMDNDTDGCMVMVVSIPQAVGTVATLNKAQMNSALFLVSIPQAVGTVATTCTASAIQQD